MVTLVFLLTCCSCFFSYISLLRRGRRKKAVCSNSVKEECHIGGQVLKYENSLWEKCSGVTKYLNSYLYNGLSMIPCEMWKGQGFTVILLSLDTFAFIIWVTWGVTCVSNKANGIWAHRSDHHCVCLPIYLVQVLHCFYTDNVFGFTLL